MERDPGAAPGTTTRAGDRVSAVVPTRHGSTLGVSSPVVQSGALALVSLAAALTFARVFDGSEWTGPLFVAAVVPHLVGLVARRRRWPVLPAALVGAAAVTIATLWATAGEATTYGLPTGATVDRIGRLADAGWSVFRTGIAPVPARPGVVLLAAIVVAAMAVAADAIARRPDVTLAALGPSLVVFVLTGTLGSRDLRVTTTIAYVTAALVALVIANAARIEQRRTWFTGRRLGSDAAIVRNAAAIGLGALVAALVVTPLVPGVDSPPVLHYRNGGASGPGFGDYTGVSPLVDLRARLNERSDVELFRVSSPVALAWRLIALDRFDGTTWSVTSSAEDATKVLRPARRTEVPITQKFSIGPLTDRWIPAAYRPIGTTNGNARAIPESDTLVSPNPVADTEYQVDSVVESPPGPDEIARTRGAVPARLKPNLEVPAGFVTDRVSAVMASTGAAPTPWAKAVALQDYFTRGRFTYDTSVDLGDGASAIDTFLSTRRGFCQQFAAAFAGIARAQGIPSRVVVGFTPGTVDVATGDYVVHGRDAHAWVELWFAGLGWRTFDPTPAGPLPGQADVRVGSVTRPDGAGDQTPTTTPATAPPATAAPRGSTAAGALPRNLDNRVSTATGSSSTTSWRTVLGIVVAGIAVLVALGALLARSLRPRRRRHRRRHASEPDARIAGAWQDALETCARAGLPTSAALTPTEAVRTLEAGGLPEPARDPFHDLVDIYQRSAYAPAPGAQDTPERAWDAADEVRRAVASGVRSRRGASGRASGAMPTRRTRRPSPPARRT
ncbi:MAG: transglutaminase TgpA family protein [Acidimicrobiia bacterium]